MSFSFTPPYDRLRGRATVGIVKTGVAQGVRVLVQLMSVIVLSRLLLPSEYGILAMAGPVVGFVGLFQDLGIAQALIQKPEVTQPEANGLFFVSAALSLVLAILLTAIGPIVSWFYGQYEVGVLTAAMGLNVLISGLGSVHFAILNRKMQFGSLALVDVLNALNERLKYLT